MNPNDIIQIVERMAAGENMHQFERSPVVRAAGRMARLLRNARKRDVETGTKDNMREVALAYKAEVTKHVGKPTSDAVYAHFSGDDALTHAAHARVTGGIKL